MFVIPDSINVLPVTQLPVLHVWLDSTFLMEPVRLATRNTLTANNVTQLNAHFVSTITFCRTIPVTLAQVDSQVATFVTQCHAFHVILGTT